MSRSRRISSPDAATRSSGVSSSSPSWPDPGGGSVSAAMVEMRGFGGAGRPMRWSRGSAENQAANAWS